MSRYRSGPCDEDTTRSSTGTCSIDTSRSSSSGPYCADTSRCSTCLCSEDTSRSSKGSCLDTSRSVSGPCDEVQTRLEEAQGSVIQTCPAQAPVVWTRPGAAQASAVCSIWICTHLDPVSHLTYRT
jgi:hypothetical protein